MKKKMALVRSAMVAVLGVTAVACSSAPGDEDTIESPEVSQIELRVVEANGGGVTAEVNIDGEAIRVTDRLVDKRRELVVERAGKELARWSFDPQTLDIHGAFDGNGFGAYADRETDNDPEHWDSVRKTAAADLLRGVATAARKTLEGGDHDPAAKDALVDIARIEEVLGNLGRWAELNGAEDAAEDSEPPASEGGERLTCSNASTVGHYIRYVQTFSTNCRVGHRAWTGKPSTSCVHSRCVQYVYDSGHNASGVYCNSYGITLDMDHVVPRGGGTHGLWSKHWSAAGLLHWKWAQATCW